jgi:hypothetical protein
MAWSYRKRIKIIPGVHLNFSKSGITTSIGIKGASMTFGKSGTYLNTGIPGTGIHNRQKLSKSDTKNTTPILEPEENIFSADVQEITSQDMQGVKTAIISAHQQRNELKKDLLKVKTTLATFNLRLFFSYLLLYGLIKKTIPTNLKSDIKLQKEAIKQLNEQIENCYVNLEIDFDTDIEDKYNKVVESFKKLCTSHKIWDVTGAHYQDRKSTRSSANAIVNKKEVRFGIKSIPDIKSKFDPLYFKNANGADLYFYPNFIVMYSSKKKFAVIGLEEIELYQSYVRFTETGFVPRDSKIIDRTWTKVNKNGTPDKRFKGNRQIPVVKYGEIKLRTNTGLNEEYEFSNYEYTEVFGETFNKYQMTIKALG